MDFYGFVQQDVAQMIVGKRSENSGVAEPSDEPPPTRMPFGSGWGQAVLSSVEMCGGAWLLVQADLRPQGAQVLPEGGSAPTPD